MLKFNFCDVVLLCFEVKFNFIEFCYVFEKEVILNFFVNLI